jgi:hypothetical protein
MGTGSVEWKRDIEGLPQSAVASIVEERHFAGALQNAPRGAGGSRES